MKYLYIDTSSSYLYSAIINDNEVVADIKKNLGQNLSNETLPEISKLFDRTNLTPNDINKIIVVNGPGSFTGIRIGITIAKVFAWSLNIPITTITSLEAMSLSCNENKIHVPLIDARRNFVFSAIYDKSKEILKPQHILIEDLKKQLINIKDYVIITNDEIKDFEKKEKYSPNFINIINYCKNKDDINPHSVNPEYLKLTEAEESKINDNKI